jgi:hypothetical protein
MPATAARRELWHFCCCRSSNATAGNRNRAGENDFLARGRFSPRPNEPLILANPFL